MWNRKWRVVCDEEICANTTPATSQNLSRITWLKFICWKSWNSKWQDVLNVSAFPELCIYLKNDFVVNVDLEEFAVTAEIVGAVAAEPELNLGPLAEDVFQLWLVSPLLGPPPLPIQIYILEFNGDHLPKTKAKTRSVTRRSSTEAASPTAYSETAVGPVADQVHGSLVQRLRDGYDTPTRNQLLLLLNHLSYFRWTNRYVAA